MIGHTALSFDAVLDATPQVTLPVVGPGVIDAAEGLLALPWLSNRSMRRDARKSVLESVDLAIGVAG